MHDRREGASESTRSEQFRVLIRAERLCLILQPKIVEK